MPERMAGLGCRLTTHASCAGRLSPAAIGRDVGITGQNFDLVHGYTERRRRNLGDDSFRALALFRHTGLDYYISLGIKADRGTILRRDGAPPMP